MNCIWTSLFRNITNFSTYCSQNHLSVACFKYGYAKTLLEAHVSKYCNDLYVSTCSISITKTLRQCPEKEDTKLAPWMDRLLRRLFNMEYTWCVFVLLVTTSRAILTVAKLWENMMVYFTFITVTKWGPVIAIFKRFNYFNGISLKINMKLILVK